MSKFGNYGERELNLTNFLGTVELQSWIFLLIDTKNTQLLEMNNNTEKYIIPSSSLTLCTCVSSLS